jgi:hypothetical protein
LAFGCFRTEGRIECFKGLIRRLENEAPGSAKDGGQQNVLAVSGESG